MRSLFEFFSGQMPWFWFSIAVVFVIMEGISFTLTTIWFSLSATVLIFVSMTSLPFTGQLYIFVGLSLLFFMYTRPFAVKWLQIKKEATNADSLIGKKIRLTKAVSEEEKGETRINGLIWSVSSADGLPLAKNTSCIVEKIAGVTLIVRSIEV